MPKVEASIEIKAPIEAVFAAVTDPKRTMEWNSNIAGITDISQYPPGPGSTWRQVTMIAGKQVDLDCRVASWNPPREGVLEVTGGQRATIITRCSASGDGTRVTQIIDFVPPGGRLGSLAGGLMSRAVGHELNQALRRQQEVLEREAGGSRGSGSR